MTSQVRRRRAANRLEVSLIKAMIVSGLFATDQDVLAHFTRPGRTINHARIVEIREAMRGEPMSRAARRFAHQPIATSDDLAAFLARFPEVDPRTGLHLVDDELIIKAREAMLFAVQAFNNPTTYFKAEIFIVAAMIAWTYALHAFFKREDVDYIYRDQKTGQPLLTRHGQLRHFDLAQCMRVAQCPLSPGEKRNLEFLLGLRHEIEHRSTSRIDDAISAKLQACCLNFSTAIKRLFGDRCGLDRELSLALQFARVDAAQRKATGARRELPPAIAAFNAAFDGNLSVDELNDRPMPIASPLCRSRSTTRARRTRSSRSSTAIVPKPKPLVSNAQSTGRAKWSSECAKWGSASSTCTTTPSSGKGSMQRTPGRVSVPTSLARGIGTIRGSPRCTSTARLGATAIDDDRHARARASMVDNQYTAQAATA